MGCGASSAAKGVQVPGPRDGRPPDIHLGVKYRGEGPGQHEALKRSVQTITPGQGLAVADVFRRVQEALLAQVDEGGTEYDVQTLEYNGTVVYDRRHPPSDTDSSGAGGRGGGDAATVFAGGGSAVAHVVEALDAAHVRVGLARNGEGGPCTVRVRLGVAPLAANGFVAVSELVGVALRMMRGRYTLVEVQPSGVTARLMAPGGGEGPVIAQETPVDAALGPGDGLLLRGVTCSGKLVLALRQFSARLSPLDRNVSLRTRSSANSAPAVEASPSSTPRLQPLVHSPSRSPAAAAGGGGANPFRSDSFRQLPPLSALAPAEDAPVPKGDKATAARAERMRAVDVTGLPPPLHPPRPAGQGADERLVRLMTELAAPAKGPAPADAALRRGSAAQLAKVALCHEVASARRGGPGAWPPPRGAAERLLAAAQRLWAALGSAGLPPPPSLFPTSHVLLQTAATFSRPGGAALLGTPRGTALLDHLAWPRGAALEDLAPPRTATLLLHSRWRQGGSRPVAPVPVALPLAAGAGAGAKAAAANKPAGPPAGTGPGLQEYVDAFDAQGWAQVRLDDLPSAALARTVAPALQELVSGGRGVGPEQLAEWLGLAPADLLARPFGSSSSSSSSSHVAAQLARECGELINPAALAIKHGSLDAAAVADLLQQLSSASGSAAGAAGRSASAAPDPSASPKAAGPGKAPSGAAATSSATADRAALRMATFRGVFDRTLSARLLLACLPSNAVTAIRTESHGAVSSLGKYLSSAGFGAVAPGWPLVACTTGSVGTDAVLVVQMVHAPRAYDGHRFYGAKLPTPYRPGPTLVVIGPGATAAPDGGEGGTTAAVAVDTAVMAPSDEAAEQAVAGLLRHLISLAEAASARGPGEEAAALYALNALLAAAPGGPAAEEFPLRGSLVAALQGLPVGPALSSDMPLLGRLLRLATGAGTAPIPAAAALGADRKAVLPGLPRPAACREQLMSTLDPFLSDLVRTYPDAVSELMLDCVRCGACGVLRRLLALGALRSLARRGAAGEVVLAGGEALAPRPEGEGSAWPEGGPEDGDEEAAGGGEGEQADVEKGEGGPVPAPVPFGEAAVGALLCTAVLAQAHDCLLALLRYGADPNSRTFGLWRLGVASAAAAAASPASNPAPASTASASPGSSGSASAPLASACPNHDVGLLPASVQGPASRALWTPPLDGPLLPYAHSARTARTASHTRSAIRRGPNPRPSPLVCGHVRALHIAADLGDELSAALLLHAGGRGDARAIVPIPIRKHDGEGIDRTAAEREEDESEEEQEAALEPQLTAGPGVTPTEVALLRGLEGLAKSLGSGLALGQTPAPSPLVPAGGPAGPRAGPATGPVLVTQLGPGALLLSCVRVLRLQAAGVDAGGLVELCAGLRSSLSLGSLELLDLRANPLTTASASGVPDGAGVAALAALLPAAARLRTLLLAGPCWSQPASFAPAAAPAASTALAPAPTFPPEIDTLVAALLAGSCGVTQLDALTLNRRGRRRQVASLGTRRFRFLPKRGTVALTQPGPRWRFDVELGEPVCEDGDEEEEDAERGPLWVPWAGALALARCAAGPALVSTWLPDGWHVASSRLHEPLGTHVAAAWLKSTTTAAVVVPLEAPSGPLAPGSGPAKGSGSGPGKSGSGSGGGGGGGTTAVAEGWEGETLAELLGSCPNLQDLTVLLVPPLPSTSLPASTAPPPTTSGSSSSSAEQPARPPLGSGLSNGPNQAGHTTTQVGLDATLATRFMGALTKALRSNTNTSPSSGGGAQPGLRTLGLLVEAPVQPQHAPALRAAADELWSALQALPDLESVNGISVQEAANKSASAASSGGGGAGTGGGRGGGAGLNPLAAWLPAQAFHTTLPAEVGDEPADDSGADVSNDDNDSSGGANAAGGGGEVQAATMLVFMPGPSGPEDLLQAEKLCRLAEGEGVLDLPRLAATCAPYHWPQLQASGVPFEEVVPAALVDGARLDWRQDAAAWVLTVETDGGLGVVADPSLLSALVRHHARSSSMSSNSSGGGAATAPGAETRLIVELQVPPPVDQPAAAGAVVDRSRRRTTDSAQYSTHATAGSHGCGATCLALLALAEALVRSGPQLQTLELRVEPQLPPGALPSLHALLAALRDHHPCLASVNGLQRAPRAQQAQQGQPPSPGKATSRKAGAGSGSGLGAATVDDAVAAVGGAGAPADVDDVDSSRGMDPVALAVKLTWQLQGCAASVRRLVLAAPPHAALAPLLRCPFPSLQRLRLTDLPVGTEELLLRLASLLPALPSLELLEARVALTPLPGSTPAGPAVLTPAALGSPGSRPHRHSNPGGSPSPRSSLTGGGAPPTLVQVPWILRVGLTALGAAAAVHPRLKELNGVSVLPYRTAAPPGAAADSRVGAPATATTTAAALTEVSEDWGDVHQAGVRLALLQAAPPAALEQVKRLALACPASPSARTWPLVDGIEATASASLDGSFARLGLDDDLDPSAKLSSSSILSSSSRGVSSTLAAAKAPLLAPPPAVATQSWFAAASRGLRSAGQPQLVSLEPSQVSDRELAALASEVTALLPFLPLLRNLELTLKPEPDASATTESPKGGVRGSRNNKGGVRRRPKATLGSIKAAVGFLDAVEALAGAALAHPRLERVCGLAFRRVAPLVKVWERGGDRLADCLQIALLLHRVAPAPPSDGQPPQPSTTYQLGPAPTGPPGCKLTWAQSAALLRAVATSAASQLPPGCPCQAADLLPSGVLRVLLREGGMLVRRPDGALRFSALPHLVLQMDMSRDRWGCRLEGAVRALLWFAQPQLGVWDVMQALSVEVLHVGRNAGASRSGSCSWWRPERLQEGLHQLSLDARRGPAVAQKLEALVLRLVCSAQLQKARLDPPFGTAFDALSGPLGPHVAGGPEGLMARLRSALRSAASALMASTRQVGRPALLHGIPLKLLATGRVHGIVLASQLPADSGSGSPSGSGSGSGPGSRTRVSLVCQLGGGGTGPGARGPPERRVEAFDVTDCQLAAAVVSALLPPAAWASLGLEGAQPPACFALRHLASLSASLPPPPPSPSYPAGARTPGSPSTSSKQLLSQQQQQQQQGSPSPVRAPQPPPFSLTELVLDQPLAVCGPGSEAVQLLTRVLTQHAWPSAALRRVALRLVTARGRRSLVAGAGEGGAGAGAGGGGKGPARGTRQGSGGGASPSRGGATEQAAAEVAEVLLQQVERLTDLAVALMRLPSLERLSYTLDGLPAHFGTGVAHPLLPESLRAAARRIFTDGAPPLEALRKGATWQGLLLDTLAPSLASASTSSGSSSSASALGSIVLGAHAEPRCGGLGGTGKALALPRPLGPLLVLALATACPQQVRVEPAAERGNIDVQLLLCQLRMLVESQPPMSPLPRSLELLVPLGCPASLDLLAELLAAMRARAAARRASSSGGGGGGAGAGGGDGGRGEAAGRAGGHPPLRRLALNLHDSEEGVPAPQTLAALRRVLLEALPGFPDLDPRGLDLGFGSRYEQLLREASAAQPSPAALAFSTASSPTPTPRSPVQRSLSRVASRSLSRSASRSASPSRHAPSPTKRASAAGVANRTGPIGLDPAALEAGASAAAEEAFIERLFGAVRAAVGRAQTFHGLPVALLGSGRVTDVEVEGSEVRLKLRGDSEGGAGAGGEVRGEEWSKHKSTPLGPVLVSALLKAAPRSFVVKSLDSSPAPLWWLLWRLAKLASAAPPGRGLRELRLGGPQAAVRCEGDAAALMLLLAASPQLEALSVGLQPWRREGCWAPEGGLQLGEDEGPSTGTHAAALALALLTHPGLEEVGLERPWSSGPGWALADLATCFAQEFAVSTAANTRSGASECGAGARGKRAQAQAQARGHPPRAQQEADEGAQAKVQALAELLCVPEDLLRRPAGEALRNMRKLGPRS
ncbi:hypothetical protein HYH03_001018 [Edaphochlamys debaryana]|uniref:Uncharacterized protein n=1 Tax=Edaphochlamys debaryana TaxID=47281 RepID=A0A836C5T7_9CHLO|nr:hypothetical protein HYH03_001018 [Edaphochlamys debaryana]|eukprot:KAG2501205.1 hypothetical protein HYH03_001018 [Edaphochlamys debaryana]